jgi:hypothetical protein
MATTLPGRMADARVITGGQRAWRKRAGRRRNLSMPSAKKMYEILVEEKTRTPAPARLGNTRWIFEPPPD